MYTIACMVYDCMHTTSPFMGSLVSYFLRSTFIEIPVSSLLSSQIYILAIRAANPSLCHSYLFIYLAVWRSSPLGASFISKGLYRFNGDFLQCHFTIPCHILIYDRLKAFFAPPGSILMSYSLRTRRTQ